MLEAKTQEITATKNSKEKTIQSVEISGSQYDSRREDTASRIIVNQAEITKYGDNNILDVLKRLPNITVSGASGFGRGAEIQMRGLGNGYTQILIDGVRAPSGFLLESLNPNSVERIEILPSASAEFSTQSIAGTINIMLKKTASNAVREVKIGAGSGRGVFWPSLNLQLSNKFDAMSYSMTANLFTNRFERDLPTSEEITDPKGNLILDREIAIFEKGHFDSINLSPRVNWKLNNDNNLSSQSFININRFKRKILTRTETNIGDAPISPEINQSTGFGESSARTELNWTRKFEDKSKLDLKFALSYSDNWSGSESFGYINHDSLNLYRFIESNGIDKGITTSGKYSSSIMEGHALLMGWETNQSARDDSRVQREMTTNEVESNFSNVNRFAAFIQDEWAPNERLSIYAGVRWEGINTDAKGSSFDRSKSNLSVISPIFQVLYKLPNSKSDQVRFAVTRTFKAPSTRQLLPRRVLSVNNSAIDPDSIGNPNLKTELATGIDIKYEHYLNAPGALLTIGASTRRITDFITQTLIQEREGRWILTPLNNGNAVSSNLELEAKFPFKLIWNQAPQLDLRASMSRNWSQVEKIHLPNNRISEQTPYSASLGIDYKSGFLTLGGSYVIRGGGVMRLSQTQERYQSVRRDLEFFSLWKLTPMTQLRFTASNVLAQDAIQKSAYINPNGTIFRRTTTSQGYSSGTIILEHKF
jgi:outer membrane receptor for ferrienterochelin and colicins